MLLLLLVLYFHLSFIAAARGIGSIHFDENATNNVGVAVGVAVARTAWMFLFLSVLALVYFVSREMRARTTTTHASFLCPTDIQSQTKPTEGVVVSMGPGKTHPETGVPVDLPCAVGDKVRFDWTRLDGCRKGGVVNAGWSTLLIAQKQFSYLFTSTVPGMRYMVHSHKVFFGK